jgi:hypothetical protein
MSGHEGARSAAGLDDTEAAALAALGVRDQWPVDELPAGVDADVLRCLDVAGFVEVAFVTMVNQQKHPRDKTPPAPCQGRWFSPIEQPEMAGTWDRIRSSPPLRAAVQPEPSRVSVQEVPRDDLGGFFPKRVDRVVSVSVPEHVPSFYVRLSERGRAELARRRRREQPKHPSELTVTEAAKQLMDVVPELSLQSARAEVSSAATDDKFKTNGKKGPGRRIDRHSFSSWLLERRKKHLDSLG